MADEHTITAPLPGIFYRRPSPDAEPCAREGDRVKVGDKVGMIEVMKSFHDVTADAEGTIVRFLVEDEDFIESGQGLVLLSS